MKWDGNKRVFRTYLRGGGEDGKACVDKHKGLDHVRSFDEAAAFRSFGAVLQPGWVDVSFDDPEMSEVFLNMAEQMNWKCLALENPSNHHLHTYWLDPKKKIKKFNKDLPLACGLVADIHGGETYIPLKVNGVDRFPPVYDILPGEDYDELPDELAPISTKIRLWHASEGDGRNNDLYSYILVLQSQLHMSEECIKSLYCDIINRWILKDKMSDKELEVILRNESFGKEMLPSFYDGSKFQFRELAEYMEQYMNVVQIRGQLHIYRDGVYVPGRKAIEKEMVQLAPTTRKSQRQEVLNYLELITKEVTVARPEFIAFKNGIYDVDKQTIMPFTPEVVLTNQIPWNYSVTAYSDVVLKFLDDISCHDEAIKQILLELIGYCMYRTNNLQKAFILVGDGANGKSTFIEVLANLLGEDNISSLGIEELSDRFSTAMLFGKLANIGDDISDDFLRGAQVSTFKKIVTGNRIKAEQKGMDPFEFNPYCKLIFSANDIPRMKDKTGAVLRRLEMIPFNGMFTPTLPDGTPNEKYDAEIGRKLATAEAMEYLILLGVRALNSLKGTKTFTSSEKVTEQINEYEIENNPIIGFIQEQGIGNILHQPTSDVFRRYQVFCTESQVQPMSKYVFSKQINKRLKLRVIQKKVDGKNHKIFERE